MMNVQIFPVGVMYTNAYIITDEDTKLTAVIDPGDVSSSLTAALDAMGKNNIEYILLTHGHFDHIGAADFYARRYDAKIVISVLDEPFLSDNALNLSCKFAKGLDPVKADIVLNDGDSVTLGNSTLRFILTPGHTQGSGCYVSEEDKVIFSGDTLFYRSIGRSDFPTSDPYVFPSSLSKLNALQGDYRVCPGHDRETTLSEERLFNPYFSHINDN